MEKIFATEDGKLRTPLIETKQPTKTNLTEKILPSQSAFEQTIKQKANELNAKKSAQAAERYKKTFGNASDNVLDSMGLAALSGISSASTGFANISRPSKANYMDDAFQQVAAEERDEMGALTKLAYDFASNFVANIPSTAASLFGGSTAGAMVTFAQTFGNSKKYALDTGHDIKTATTYAFFEGLNEATLDKLLDGLAGKSVVSEKAAKVFADNVKKGFAKFFVRLGHTTISEYVQESIQTATENKLKNLLLGENNDTSIFSDEAIYAGLLGAMSAASARGAGAAVRKTATDLDTAALGNQYITGENGHTIDEAIKIGLNNARSGDIYRTAVKLENKVKNDERVTALEVGDIVKRSGSAEAITARLIEEAVIESAQKHNVNPTVAENAAAISSCTGIPIVFAEADNMKIIGRDGKEYYESGRFDRTDGVITLNAGITTVELADYVLKHELAHRVELSGMAGQLEKIVRSSMGAQFDTAVQEKIAEYQRYGKPLSEANAKHEVVAHWLGKNLYQNGFAQAVVNGDAKVGNVILRTLDQVRLALGGTQKSRTAANIAIVERLFMRALEQSPALDSASSAQSYISDDFYSKFDAWDGKNPNETFTIGTTSEALQSIGIRDQEIKLHSGTVISKLNKHPEMTRDIFRQIPELLENPVIVQFSDAIDPNTGKPKYESRITILGELYAEMNIDGKVVNKPVLVSMELLPRKKKTAVIADFSIITSAYGHSKLQRYLNENSILYIDPNKKRTDQWLSRTGLQLPVGENTYGPVRRITYSDGKVKIENSTKENAMTAALRKAGFVNSYGDSIFDNTANDTTKNSQSSFEGSDDIAEALAMMERERAEKADSVEETGTLPLSRQSPTDPLTRGTEGDVQDAGVTPATDIPNPLESGRALEHTQSNAQTVDELTAEIGEEAVYCRMYNAAQIERPPSTMEINGQTVDTVAYMDELFLSLPDDDLQLTAYLKEKEAAKAAQLAEQFSRGETDTEWTELDLQIQTARSKLEWSALEDSGESGKKVRRFYEQRLKGKDVNKAHETELLELLAGRNETYSPIANQKTLEQAKDKLRNAEYQAKLQKRILRYKPNDLFNAVDAAAAQVMINDARNAGDLELYADLVQGLSRKGTELGRAVQVLSMQRRMTPEGTLKAAQRTFHKQADKMIYDGANEDLDTFSAHVVDAIERATENKAATTSGDNQQYVQQGGEAVHNPMSREELTDALVRDIAGDNSPYITADEIRGILERAVDNASDIPDQLRRHLKKKIGKDMGTLAQRIATLQQAGHLNDATMRRVMEETLGLPTLSTEDVATLTELVNEMNRAAPDSAEQLEATESIYRFLGGKLAVDLFDTIQAWRKFGMLFNIKTHLRNIGSNAVFAGVNRLDSATETILEHVFSRYLNQEQRTAAFGWSFTEHGRQIRPIVEKSARQALLRLQGQGQKYEISNGVLEQYRKVFGTKKVGEALNKTNEWNSRWLEKEDAKFFLPAYTNALGQIMTARGLTEVTTEAAELAFQRASESVFRGENAMTDVFTSLKRYQNSTNTGRRLFGYAVDIAIPFTKTPANIAYQAVEHSPIGVVKGAFDLFQATRGKGSKDVAGAINTISKGVTGSALMAIGMLLGSAGLFVTGFGKTEKERAADELAGIQENAFRFGNVTISLDWLQPAASPLIVGASIGQRLQEDGLSLGSVFGAVFDGTDSLFEMTMLQSLYDVLGGYNAGASASVASVAENLLSQSIPTAVGQVARAVDPVQRKTNGESKLSSVIGTGTFAKIIQKIMARVPGLTYLLEPELDVWGNTVYRTGKASTASVILNALQQFILPANVKIATGDDEISQIVMALYNSDEQQTGRAIPTAITREKAAEMGVSYEDANRLLGQNQHAALLSILQDREKYTVTQTISRGGKSVKQKRQKYWSDMTDEERLQVLKKVYQSEKDSITDQDGEYYDEIVRRMN